MITSEGKADNNGRDWVFVAGVNNSGTSLCCEILSRIPQIGSMRSEGQIVTTSLPRPWEYGVARLWTQRMDIFRMSENTSRRTATQCRNDWLHAMSPGRFALEKSPPNTVRIPWLRKNFFGCKILFIFRDPIAVVEGIKRRAGAEIAAGCDHYIIANTIAMIDCEPLQDCLFLSYEDLTKKPQSQVSKALEFLGLSRNEAAPLAEAAIRETGCHISNRNDNCYASLTKTEVRYIKDRCENVYASLKARQA